MIAIPFVYFSFLSIILYLKKGKKFDFSVVITTMFAISGFFSILVDVFDLRNPDVANYNISVTASFFYCALLTMCILPFAIYSNLRITNPKPLRNTIIIKLLAYLSVLWFLMTIYFSWPQFIIMLTTDMRENRLLVYSNMLDSWMDNVPGIFRSIIIILNLIFSCSWGVLFLAFFSRYVQHMPRVYFWMFLVASLSGPYGAVLGADRSKVAYWILTAFGFFMLFKPFIVKKELKKLVRLGVVVMTGLVIYLVLMTVSRFSDSSTSSFEDGALNSLIYYWGISYVNFCNFFDNYTPPFSHLGIIFPFINKYVFGVPSGGTIIQEQMSNLTGFECGTFYTFIGQIIMGTGRTIAILFCFIYTFFSYAFLPSALKKSGTNISSLFLYFALVSVVYLGLFVYYYTSPYLTFSLFFLYFLLRISR